MADMLERSAKIYVAGHRGLVGSAIWNNLLYLESFLKAIYF